jgi:hypothetical protein
MSETGLYSGLYQNLHECAELVDQVLVHLKTGKSLPEDSSRQALGRLLTQLAEEQPDDMPTRLIQLLLRNRRDVSSADLARVGRALNLGDIEVDTINQLEAIAQALEEEQSRAMARIQQWTG